MVKAHIADRAWRTLDLPLSTDILGDVTDDLYHPATNPGGYINLATPANTLMHENLAIHLKEHFNPAPRAFTYGNGSGGSTQLKTILAQFFNDRFAPVQPVECEHLAITDGVSAALKQCILKVAEPGDMILIGRPYHSSHASELFLQAGVLPFPVSFGSIDPFGVEAVTNYEQALLAAEDSADGGGKVRALFISSPHDPLGQCYPRKTLEALLRLCQRWQIHLIADESYATTTYDSTSTTMAEAFTSILALGHSDVIDSSLLHVLWEPGKQLGADSIHLCCIISPDSQLLVDDPTSYAAQSSPSAMFDHIMCCVFEHQGFLNAFIAENRRKLAESYALVAGILVAYSIPFHPNTNAGFCVYANLGEALKQRRVDDAEKSSTDQKLGSDGGQSDRDLYANDNATIGDLVGIASQFQWTDLEIMASLHARKVLIEPGASLGSEGEGWFRIVFSHDRQTILEGLSRIMAALGLHGDGTSELAQYRSDELPKTKCNCGLCGVINA